MDNYGYFGDDSGIQYFDNDGNENLSPPRGRRSGGMAGLGDDSSSDDTSWLSSVTSVLAPLAVGYETSQTTQAIAAGTAAQTASTSLSTNTLLTIGAVGIGLVVIMAMMKKKK